MGTNLFGFVFNSIRKRANDPKNAAYWLPKALQRTDKPGGGKLLPLQGESWNLGEITGEAGITFASAIMGQWWLKEGRERKGDPQLATHQPIACPSQPWPRLAMPSITVGGLENVWLRDNPVLTEPGTGYSTVMTLEFGRYGQEYGLGQLTVTGDYTLDQCVCSALNANPSEGDGWIPPENIHGRGSFQMTLTGVYVDASVNVQVAGSGSGRSLKVTVDSLKLRGEGGQLPTLTVDELTVKSTWTWMANNIWLPQAQAALESEDGLGALIANINAALNEAGSRQKLADMLTPQIARMQDDTLGAVPAGTLPAAAAPKGVNPADQYLFDRIRVALNNPASDYYLPKVIKSNASPRLEPYQIDSIALGSQTYSGIQFQNIKLHGVKITGLSTTVAPSDQLAMTAKGLDGTLRVSTLTATGEFAMNIAGDPTVLGGTVTIRASKASLSASVSLSGDEVANLTVQFKQLRLSATSSDIAVSAKMTSVFADIVNQVLNQDAVKQSVIKGINDQAAKDLALISTGVTEGSRKLIAAKLDG